MLRWMRLNRRREILRSTSNREGSARGGVVVGVEVKRLRALGMKRLKFARVAVLALCGAALIAPQAASATVESRIVVGGLFADIEGVGGTAQLPQNGDDTITAGQVANVIAGGVPVARVISARRLAASQRLPDQVDRLYRAAWALCRSPDDAEDLVQETFARVLARPRHLHRGDELPYLLGALRNTHLTALRTQQRRPSTVELPSDESETMRSALAEPETALEQQELLATIAALPDKFRQTLIAVDLVGLSYREAARALKVREATITTRLHRARQSVATWIAAQEEPDAPSDSRGASR
jgi:RNA polymerase sigma-70 factor (ECF subfamily)